MKRSENTPEIKATRPARTLAELGVPAALAMELEGTLRALGESSAAARRWRVFVTPDGAAHPLRLW